MLFNKINLDLAIHLNKFKLKEDCYKGNWQEYYDSYNYTIKCLLDDGKLLNSKAKCITFLIRHSIELCLKLNLNNRKIETPTTHELSELLKLFPDKNIIPTEFEDIINIIEKDKDGACYRYAINKETDQTYFKLGDTLELYKLLTNHKISENTSEFIVGKIYEKTDFNNKEKWDLTFHLGEASKLGQIRTQYDLCIETLALGVLKNKFDIKKLYIPLMFMIRHSLELALKSNIHEVQEVPSLIKDKDFSHEHSLSKLFNCYNDYLKKLNLEDISTALKIQIKEYIEKYNRLNELVHQLDKNSQYFRFPFDNKGNLHKISGSRINFIDMLKLYYYTDPFITFNNNVLKECGLLEMSIDEY